MLGESFFISVGDIRGSLGAVGELVAASRAAVVMCSTDRILAAVTSDYRTSAR